jgi:hypothetical protein
MNTFPRPEVGSNSVLRLKLLGVGAMNSPRYATAGLLVEYDDCRVMLDGGGSAEPKEHIDAWLVSDERSELQQEIRKQALARGLEPLVSRYERCGLRVEPRSVVHTSHPTFGYLITAAWPKRCLGTGVPGVSSLGHWRRLDVRGRGRMAPPDPFRSSDGRSRGSARCRPEGAATAR